MLVIVLGGGTFWPVRLWCHEWVSETVKRACGSWFTLIAFCHVSVHKKANARYQHLGLGFSTFREDISVVYVKQPLILSSPHVSVKYVLP